MLVGRGGVDDPLRTAGRLRAHNIREQAGGRKQTPVTQLESFLVSCVAAWGGERLAG